MKILITGGRGFIARSLTEQLGSEYAILAPHSLELNLLDPAKVLAYLKKNKFEAVIHAATYDAAPKDSIKDPAAVLENNLRMFFALARGKDYFGKLIYFGSGAEFAREHWLPSMKEDYFDRHLPADQYGFSKYLMTRYALTSKNIYNLRLFAVFGEYDDWRYRFLSNICCRAILNLPLLIHENKVFDFLYVKDLAKILKWFINHTPLEQAYNICSGQSYAFKTLAEKILKISGKNLEIQIEKKDSKIEYSGDNSRLLRELPKFKFTPIDQALAALYNWHAANQNLIEKDKL